MSLFLVWFSYLCISNGLDHRSQEQYRRAKDDVVRYLIMGLEVGDETHDEHEG